MNIVVLNGTAGSYLTVFPPDQPRPLAASMNWVAGQAPTPNGVVSKLSADGRLGLYNLSGNVDVIIDIVGYYETGAGGAIGPAGATGATGAAGPRGFSAWNTIPSGTTVIGSQSFDIDAGQINADFQFTIPFPGQAPAVPATSFAPDFVPGTIGESALCTGTSLVPTAPAGRACLYIVTSSNISSAQAVLPHLTRTGFLVTWTAPAAGDSYIKFNWAYTAP